ncbi:MAG: hypothetical protein J0L67_12520 [Cytophagales bacterium]|nr:hypothetical protein [Cytophagales bacterium]
MKLLASICFLFVSNSLAGQNYFMFTQKQIAEISSTEESFQSKKLKTKNIYLSTDFYPLADKYEVEFPISYLRTNDTLINSCMVQYFFTATDSKIRLIVYDWDETQRTDLFKERTDIMKAERQRLKEYLNKYDQIFQIISSQLGIPLKDTKLKDVANTNSKYKERITTWKKENLTVEEHLLFTISDNELGTYQVSVKAYWD